MFNKKEETIHLYEINIKYVDNTAQYEELIKVFLKPSEYVMVKDGGDIVINQGNLESLPENKDGNGGKNVVKREIYDALARLTGRTHPWGILIGIRPVKLCGEIYEKNQSTEETLETLRSKFYLAEDKAKLLLDMYLHQQKYVGKPAGDSVGIYIGIPFCPTRCLYCSFASNQVKHEEISRYLEALHREIEFVGRKLKEEGNRPESIYIGGGTPTTLTADELDAMLSKVEACFDLTAIREFTVEAGRPDTITREKLEVLRSHNIERISINPQSMKDETLELIGRNHSVNQIRQAFQMARDARIKDINADIIAGLPGESLEDFEHTLDEVLGLGATNITVHTLAVKRASRLVELDSEFHYKQVEAVEEMLAYSRQKLKDKGFLPYYLYRQKHMMGAKENTGYCILGHDCIYNVRIMEERQSIIALGAGGITKVYFPEEDRLERVPNVTNYQEYISRIDEMLDRKEKNYFRRYEKC